MDPGRTGVIRRSVAVRHQGPPSPPGTSPETLFPDLPRSDKGPKDLWAHQADVLRDYLAHVDDADLAIELPTGAGKTLVGMLASQLQPAPP
jgi:superfamily II DNA or RNA helicase